MFLRIFITISTAFILSYFLPEKNFFGILQVLYSVSGILFSIGLGLIAGFDFSRIRNKEFLQNVRENISETRKSFILYFVLATISFILSDVKSYTALYENIFIKYSFSANAFCFIFLGIIYFILNFLALQKLKDEIIDKTFSE